MQHCFLCIMSFKDSCLQACAHPNTDNICFAILRMFLCFAILRMFLCFATDNR